MAEVPALLAQRLYTGRLTAPDTLELMYVEAGHAAVYRAQLTPKK